MTTLFHLNMKSYSGSSFRSGLFLHLFEEFAQVLQNTTVLAAGFTEMFPAKRNDTAIPWVSTFCRRMKPDVQNVSQWGNGVAIYTGLTNEFVTIFPNAGFQIAQAGYAFQYQSQLFTNQKQVKAFSYPINNNNYAYPPPDYITIRQGLYYELTPKLRGICFVSGVYNQVNVVVGFFHNVYQQNDPAIMFGQMPALFDAIRAAVPAAQFVIIGGDFNLTPRTVTSNRTNTVATSYFQENQGAPVLTTSAHAIDFWISDSTNAPYGNNLNNQYCAVYPQFWNGLLAPTDHAAITMDLNDATGFGALE